MGLDQYAYTNATEEERRDDEGHTYMVINGGKEFYWRKHSRLQTFMEKLWAEKGMTETFNCQNLELTKADLEKLKKAIDSGFSDDFCSGGFFYGHQFQEEAVNDYKQDDLDFVTEALASIDRGEKVIYTCWW